MPSPNLPDLSVLSRHPAHGPRYTSYPTANQFRSDFGPADYCRHAESSNQALIPLPLSLYVHVPFCASPCFYCGCTRVITRERRRAGRYLDLLGREMAMHARLFDPDRPVEQLHLGGGTPTFLDDAQIERLLGELDAHFHLAPAALRESSIEIDPRGVDAARIGRLAALGFNRMSFGVQDFDPAVQQAVNRIQTVSETAALIEAARRHGIGSINIDLIYGLPLQTAESFKRTLELVVDLQPDRLAVYGYAHLPHLFKAQRRIDPAVLPDAKTKLALLRLAIETLCAAGYVYIGMDHFARPEDPLARAMQNGGLHRNFQGYSTRPDCDLIGMGVSAISQVGGCYSQNARTLPDYTAAIEAGRLPISRGFSLGEEDLLRRDVIQSIMCEGRVRFDEVEAQAGRPFTDVFDAELPRLHALADDGLIRFDAQGFSVTPSGRLLLRLVAMVFDRYLPLADPMRPAFSRVV